MCELDHTLSRQKRKDSFRTTQVQRGVREEDRKRKKKKEYTRMSEEDLWTMTNLFVSPVARSLPCTSLLLCLCSLLVYLLASLTFPYLAFFLVFILFSSFPFDSDHRETLPTRLLTLSLSGTIADPSFFTLYIYPPPPHTWHSSSHPLHRPSNHFLSFLQPSLFLSYTPPQPHPRQAVPSSS
ncbi:hypothetical protein BKA57DRAFT_143368 [Linnemannia elongata]|nr:hypothetical protein BKA57DRAFT_143368 [Linnemannia elongata]